MELANVPESEKSKEDYIALVDNIRMHNIQNGDQLLEFINHEISSITVWLQQNNSTGIQTIQLMTKKVAKLDQLKYWKTLCEQYDI
jgi:hypothetical protein